MIRGRYIASYGYARIEKLALIGLILDGYADLDRLHTLKSSGWLEISALLTAVQGHAALGAFTFPIDIRRQSGGTVKTSRCGDVLEQAREPRASDVNRRTRTRWLGAIFTPEPVGFAIGIHVAPLPVFAVVVHVLSQTPGKCSRTTLLDYVKKPSTRLFRSKHPAMILCRTTVWGSEDLLRVPGGDTPQCRLSR
jgi:hypothetical protein